MPAQLCVAEAPGSIQNELYAVQAQVPTRTVNRNPAAHRRGRGRIRKHGPALLRKLLVECACCTLRYNAWARANPL